LAFDPVATGNTIIEATNTSQTTSWSKDLSA
jgi:hypothetical protein